MAGVSGTARLSVTSLSFLPSPRMSFVHVSSGDNFYDLGISATLGVNDPQWNSSWANIYSAASLKTNAVTGKAVPW